MELNHNMTNFASLHWSFQCFEYCLWTGKKILTADGQKEVKNMKYVKPVVLAQNSSQGAYALDCSRNLSPRACGSCQFPK